jgi:hypothetical protein
LSNSVTLDLIWQIKITMKIKSFLIASVLSVAILGFGFAASAQTTDNSALIAQLQAQIQSLMQQIQQLIAQQGGQGWCHTFNNYSVAGSTNGDVSYLQTALTKQGFDVSGDGQGTFGDNTAAGVVSFQGKYGIRQTGTVGPITRTKLNALYGCGTTPTPPTPTPASWQTYTGPNNDYSISYPSDYTVDSSDSTCVVVQNSIGGIYINDGFNSNVPGQAMPASCGPRFGGSSTASRTTENVNVGGQQYSATGWVEKSGYISGFFTFGLTDKITVSYEVNYMAPANGIFPTITDGQYNSAMISLKKVLATMNSSLMPSSSLKITSPASGSTLVEGQTYPIKWTGGSGNYNVYVNCTNAPIGDEGYVGSVKASDGIFQWTVRNFSDITTSANCRLNFLYPSNNLPVAYSNYFTITAIASAQPTGSLIPSTTFVNFNLVQGHSAQPTQIILTNASSSLVSYTISVPNQPAWLNSSYNTQTMSLQGGGVMGIGVSVDSTKVSGPGTYTANIVVTGNFSNSPISIPVTLTVTSQVSLPVSVTSPNGGETFTAGQTYQITWNAPNDSASQNMQITLANGDAGEVARIGNGCIEQGVIAPVPSSDPNARYLQANCSGINAPVPNTGSYTWTVPASLPSGSHYYMYVGELKIMGDGDFSNSAFSIVAAQPTITINSVGGTTLTPGQTYPITWTSTGIASNAQLEICLNPSGPSPDNTCVTTMPNSGIYNWTVPKQSWIVPQISGSLSPKNYTMTIYYAQTYGMYTGSPTIAQSGPSATFSVTALPCNTNSDCGVIQMCSSGTCVVNPNAPPQG